MPRKAAPAPASTDAPAEPRRSSRIKEQPKPEKPSKRAPAKPRAKKAKPVEEKEGEAQDDGEEVKPKSTRGKKRTSPEKDAEGATEPAAVEEEAPPAKKAKPDSKPASKAASKPASRASAKPPSRTAPTKPPSKAGKPASRASAKPPSTAKKPASRAGSKKPSSKVRFIMFRVDVNIIHLPGRSTHKRERGSRPRRRADCGGARS
ncbi:hypothetical protein F5I97DRAFT_47192 [Phlebopus sp. FC_14]|nr:hypothetical protein F5I97DRAFT_47192 [Phlebopus sp. FC_14]